MHANQLRRAVGRSIEQGFVFPGIALTLGKLFFCVATISSGVAAEVQEKRIFTNQSGVFTIIEENDLIVRTDRHYTQGIKLSYLQADGVVPRVAERMAEMVPSVAYKPDALKFGFQIGQSMFTPANIRTTALIPNDRPYAGWLYTGLILQRRGEIGRAHV